jgi:glutathione S-transferase
LKLIGTFDSPFVRRVGISLTSLGVAFEHRPISLFKGFADFAAANPAVKAPTLVTDDGQVLQDSNLILQYLELVAPDGKSLLPEHPERLPFELHLIGFALAGCEKAVQTVYETKLRPPERQDTRWLDRVGKQLRGAFGALERSLAQRPEPFESRLTQANITVAVAWRFVEYALPGTLDPDDHPNLAAHTARAEERPEFKAVRLP